MSKQISDELAEKLKVHILQYPSLFKRGGDILNHIFLVNGNGYEWENGEPTCYTDPSANTRYESFENYFADHLKYKSYPGGHPKPDDFAMILDRYTTEMYIRATAFDRAKDKRVTLRTIYEKYDGHSILDTMPDDALPVWKEAAEIVREMMQWYPTDRQRTAWKKEEWIIRRDLDV